MALQEAQRFHRKFLLRLMLFFLPLVAVIAVVEGVLWRVGETLPVSRVMEIQERKPEVIWQRGIFDQSYSLRKYLHLKKHLPSVLALGSSRATLFHRKMFGEPDFFIGGGLLRRVEDLEGLLNTLPNYRPRVMILDLDFWWFNRNYLKRTIGRYSQLAQDRQLDPVFRWEDHVSAWREIASRPAYFSKYALHPHPDRLGLNAQKGQGFRLSGEMVYEYALPKTKEGWRYLDRAPMPHVLLIRQGMEHFVPTKHIAEEEVERLRRVLEALKARGVLVLGFLPPMSSEALKALQKSEGQKTLLKECREQIPKVFQALDLPFIDATDLKDFGLDDRFMLDGKHAFETFHLHLLRRFLQERRVRDALPNALPTIEKALKSPKTNFWYADYGEAAK